MAQASEEGRPEGRGPPRRQARPLAECQFIMQKRRQLRNHAVTSGAVGAIVGGAAGHSIGSALFPRFAGGYTLHVPSAQHGAGHEVAARARQARQLGGLWVLPGPWKLTISRPTALITLCVGLGVVLGVRTGVKPGDWAWLRSNPDPSRAEMIAAERAAATGSTLVMPGRAVSPVVQGPSPTPAEDRE